jgi:hypothetical protein
LSEIRIEKRIAVYLKDGNTDLDKVWEQVPTYFQKTELDMADFCLVKDAKISKQRVSQCIAGWHKGEKFISPIWAEYRDYFYLGKNLYVKKNL